MLRPTNRFTNSIEKLKNKNNIKIKWVEEQEKKNSHFFLLQPLSFLSCPVERLDLKSKKNISGEPGIHSEECKKNNV